MNPLGKSIFIWQIPAILNGDIHRIAIALKTAGFQSAILHAENLSVWRSIERVQLVAALKAAGVTSIGGAAVYNVDPAAEGRQAAAICQQYDLPAFVFDAEAKFDAAPNADSGAVKLLQAFRSGAPGKLAGWCWWAFYQSSSGAHVYHPKSVLWAAMNPAYGNADFGMPMTYWSWGDSPALAVRYLDESIRQWRLLTQKPIIPAGRAYVGDGGTATPEAIKAYEQRARELGAEGVTWWSMQHALTLPGVWSALSTLQPFGQSEPCPEPESAPAPAGLYMRAVRFVNVRTKPEQASTDVGDVNAGEMVGPIIGIAGGKTGAWAHLANGRYVCVADQNGIQYLVEA